MLGYLDPGYFLGGKMGLDVAAARAAIAEKVAAPLGMPVEQAAWGIHQIANENMANAARVHVLERGKDPHRFPLFAFGGAGPVHAYRMAMSLGVPALLLPFGAGVMSTLGFLSAPLAFDFVRSWREQLQKMDWAKANALLDAMEAEGRALLEESGVPPEAISHRREADMRYVGQGHEIRRAAAGGRTRPGQRRRATGRLRGGVPRTVRAARAGRAAGDPELAGGLVRPAPVRWRCTSPPRRMPTSRRPARASGRPTSPRLAASLARRFYDRYKLAPGMAFVGPAIVEEREVDGDHRPWRALPDRRAAQSGGGAVGEILNKELKREKKGGRREGGWRVGFLS